MIFIDKRYGALQVSAPYAGLLVSGVICILMLFVTVTQPRAEEQPLTNTLDFKRQIEQLKKAKRVVVYWGISGPKGGSDSPYANNREYYRASPKNEAELKAWSCAYNIENNQAMSDLTEVLLTKTDWSQLQSYLNSPTTMKYIKKNGVMEYEKFNDGHVVIDFMFEDETQARFFIGGDYISYRSPPVSGNEVNYKLFFVNLGTNNNEGSRLGVRFFEWLRHYGKQPKIGDLQRLSHDDCEFWLHRSVYKSWSYFYNVP